MDVERLTIEEALQEEEREKPIKISVLEEIEKGKHLYEERLKRKLSEEERVKPLYLSNEDEADPQYFIWKLRFSMQPKQKCEAKKHINHFVIERDILTRKEHVDYLAQPKKMENYVPKVKYWYKKAFPTFCTPRIAELALPKRKRVLETLNSSGYVLPQKNLENLANLLKTTHFCTVRDAANVYRAEKTCHRLLKKRKLREAKRLKKKIENLEREEIKGILVVLAEAMKDNLIEQHRYILPENNKNMAKVILEKLSTFLGISIEPCNKDDPVQELLSELSENLAVWTRMFLQSCGHYPASAPDEELKKIRPHETCPAHVPSKEYLIEDYIEYEASGEANSIDEDFKEEQEANEEDVTEGKDKTDSIKKIEAADEEVKNASVDVAPTITTE